MVAKLCILISVTLVLLKITGIAQITLFMALLPFLIWFSVVFVSIIFVLVVPLFMVGRIEEDKEDDGK